MTLAVAALAISTEVRAVLVGAPIEEIENDIAQDVYLARGTGAGVEPNRVVLGINGHGSLSGLAPKDVCLQQAQDGGQLRLRDRGVDADVELGTGRERVEHNGHVECCSAHALDQWMVH